MQGMPTTKEVCLVLWRNNCIPRIEPTLPPRIAERKSVFSGMRHFPRRAFDLSSPIRKKAVRLMKIR